jgi:alginate O-acetyltransferase complex protein AlgJ
MPTLSTPFPTRARPFRFESVVARVRAARNVLTVGLFLAAIGYPLVGFLFLTPAASENENRTLRPPPRTPTLEKWTWVTYPLQFEWYFGDRIGGRSELLALRTKILLDELGDRPTTNVWFGTDGWLFHNAVESVADPVHRYPDLTPAVGKWADEFAARQRWCADRGIRYVVVICPDKDSIYPEYLDAVHQRHPPPRPLPTLSAALAGTPVRVVDLTPEVRSAKADPAEPIYFRLDTHWNALGSMAGYRDLARAIEADVPGFPARPVGDFVRSPFAENFGDLARMAGLPQDRQREPVFAYWPGPTLPAMAEVDAETVAAVTGRATALTHIPPHIWHGDPRGPRIVFCSDSFGQALTPLLAPDCSRLVAVGTYGLPTELIEREKPVVVVQELVERVLWNEALIDPLRR